MAGCFVYFDGTDGEEWGLRSLDCILRHGVAERLVSGVSQPRSKEPCELEEWPQLHRSMKVSLGSSD